jgi:glycerophosphoryl diester phosphodiesterase
MSKGSVEWVAHRGESYLAPENTMAAIDLAWKSDVDAVEIDIHLTRDGKLVVCHDADTARTCGTKLVIKENTLEELRRLDAGAWKAAKYKGEKLATLEEAVGSVPAGKRLFIEVKCGPEAMGELARVAETSAKSDDQWVIISFRQDVVEAAKKRLPKLKAFYLADFKQDPQSEKWTPTARELIEIARRLGADGLDLHAQPPVDAAFVKTIHDAGLEFSAWTIDDPDVARKLVAMQVDSITSNRAAWMKEQIGTQLSS